MHKTSDTAIKNGILVTGRESKRADIYINNDGRVEGIETEPTGRAASRVIDASGKWILPGIIDAHLHPVYADGMDTLSKAAACEGITTLIPYIGAVKAWGQTGGLLDTIEDFIEEGERTSVIDFGVHCTLLQDDVKDARTTIPKLVDRGIMSFKVFMAYKKRGMKLEDDEILHIMDLIAASNGLLAAHAENGAVIDFLEQRFISQGKETPDYHAPSHPGLSEAEAIFRLLTLGGVTQCPIYIPHISAKESLEVVRLFKKWGELEFFTETCPHYLTLTDDETAQRGSIAKMAPPLREQSDIEALWQAVQEGLIDVIGSDHAGNTTKANEPLRDKIFDAPNGIPGLDTLFKVVHQEGVNKGRITLNRLVEVLCEKPAKIFGLYPRKGTLNVGSDADIVLFDPAATDTIKARNPLLKVDYSLYEKRTCLGAPSMVMQRGRVLMEDGELTGKPGGGMFLPGKKEKC
jgi:dihydropyrimidinase